MLIKNKEMKVENLKRAVELKEQLRIINSRIDTVEKAELVKMCGGGNFTVSTAQLKYSGKTIFESVKPLFLDSLKRERQEILDEIKTLD